MIFCPVGAVQDTASDVAEAIALMPVTGPGSGKSHTSTQYEQRAVDMHSLIVYAPQMFARECVPAHAYVFGCLCAIVYARL